MNEKEREYLAYRMTDDEASSVFAAVLSYAEVMERQIDEKVIPDQVKAFHKVLTGRDAEKEPEFLRAIAARLKEQYHQQVTPIGQIGTGTLN